jgi:hypothetical protein
MSLGEIKRHSLTLRGFIQLLHHDSQVRAMDVTPITGSAQLRMGHHGVSFSIGLQNLAWAKSDAKATALAPVVENVNFAPGELFFRFHRFFALSNS